MTPAPSRAFQMRDAVSAEEIAAVLAALDAVLQAARPLSPADQSGYEHWRLTRLKALRAG